MSRSITLTQPGSAAQEEILLDIWSRTESSRHDVVNPATYKRPFVLSSHKPRLFALLIGIDGYQTFQPLRGAVSDALAVKEYLENHLGVPPENINTLLNRSATRHDIIQGLRQLKENNHIEKGDPILVYYAGYGGEVAYDDEMRTMEFIVPQDYCETAGYRVPAIPHRTLAGLLVEIAQSQGNNITVVLDCSHSTLGAPPFDRYASTRIRSVPLHPGIHPPSLEQDVYGNSELSQFLLLKACSSLELARETYANGNFSKVFLRLLRNQSPHELRYADIPSHIDQIPSQTPRVEGPDLQRTLFDGKVLVTHRNCYHLTVTSESFVLHAGTIHGITPGSEFTVYASTDTSFQTPLGILSVESVGAFSTVLAPHPGAKYTGIDGDSYAVQTKAGEREDVRFYFPTDDLLRPCYEALLSLMQSGEKDVQHVSLVDDPKDAHIEIAVENEKIIFLIRDEQVLQHGLSRLYCGIDPAVEDMISILKAAALYYWKLNRTNNNPDISHNVEVEFYRLADISTDADSFGHVKMAPASQNLCQNNTVEFVVDDSPYGLQLVNNSPYDLYPYLFYFDCSDLSIGAYFQPPRSQHGTLEAPLRKNGGTVTIGYGSQGGTPVAYYLRESQNVDVGFLKLFLSTKPVDLSAIPQPTPFESSRSASNFSKPVVDTWATILTPVVQHRFSPRTNQCPKCSYVTPGLPSHIDMRILGSENTALKKELDIQRERFTLEIQRLHDKTINLSEELKNSKLVVLETQRKLQAAGEQAQLAEQQENPKRRNSSSHGPQRLLSGLMIPKAMTHFASVINQRIHQKTRPS